MKTNGFSAEICKARGGAHAIATMTFDDGVSASSFALYGLLRSYGLSATLFLVPSRIMGIAPYSSGYLDLHDVHNLIATGRIDPESHSYSHLYLAKVGHVDYKAENCTDENREREISGSRAWLEKHFPGRPFISFGVPGGNYDDKAQQLVMSSYYSSRVGHLLEGEMQSLTPDDTSLGGWYSLKSKWLGEKRLSDILEYLDRCVRDGGWFITGCHNIVGTEIGKGNYEISIPTLSIFFEKLALYRDRGQLWIATLKDATRYLREYESSELFFKASDGEITLEIKMKDKTKRGLPLTPSIFNMPLTVRVKVPDGWQSAECISDGTSAPCEISEDENGKYLYVYIVPNTKATVRRCEK